ncbi:MAG: hypothetical protein Q8O15_07770 [Rectinemataceae bacterium]|nr:hypothetical protein [Rectinemataceae bacterium]
MIIPIVDVATVMPAENPLGIIRRFIPKGSDIGSVAKRAVRETQNGMNTYPREILNCHTPLEILVMDILQACAEDQVWVDGEGRLHLMLQNRAGVWTASELMAKKDAGYGIYSFDVEGSVHDLDPNIVFGYFSWDQNVQPYDRVGNQHSFDLPKAKTCHFEMRWEPGRARLRINLWLFRGKEPDRPGPWEVVLSNLRISPLQ